MSMTDPVIPKIAQLAEAASAFLVAFDQYTNAKAALDESQIDKVVRDFVDTITGLAEASMETIDALNEATQPATAEDVLDTLRQYGPVHSVTTPLDPEDFAATIGMEVAKASELPDGVSGLVQMLEGKLGAQVAVFKRKP